MNLKKIYFVRISRKILCASLFIFAVSIVGFAQNIKRTTVKVERTEIGAGGSVTLVGAPEGSISIESWQKPEVEVTAEIEVEAASEADLTLLAQVNNFMFDESLNSVRILTTGAHDKQFLKKNFKNFPKRLLNSKYRINYSLKVPVYCDLTVDAGRGKLDLRGVEGAIYIKALDAEIANLNLVGGLVQATFGAGKVNVNFAARSWRGRDVEVQLAKGDLSVNALQSLNADLDLNILRIGKIENGFETLKPRDKSKFTETSMLARAGVGGARFTFTVGDGTLRLAPQ